MIDLAEKKKLQNEFLAELNNILTYWAHYTIDINKGGFYGAVSNNNIPDIEANKGSILNARILWSFAAGFKLTGNILYKQMAERAYHYITSYFIDREYGGVYWSLTSDGQPLDTKKQIYAIAFTIYGLAEYYQISKNPEVLEYAEQLYNAIEIHSYDNIKGGYIEAFTCDWKEIEDARLSLKDANERKTMNTHLHILEAYTNLYRIWPNAELAVQIKKLIEIFTTYIINPSTSHLNLFFDDDWMVKSSTVSYGHDIETSWLLLEAAKELNDEVLIKRIETVCLQMARVSTEGLNNDGSLNYEYEPVKQELVEEKHWWVQAEAVVGFFNAWQISHEEQFFELSKKSWQYIKKSIVDAENGEWFWGIDKNNSIMQGYTKVGFWKCPYHNSRVCCEMVKRLSV